ncbi:hypothetical protein R3I93_003703 [Phoxinus phoxinus]|uniref:Uncharacterized protein n=1 Tax=Phoxinus phoxinus TaxID=58324 RepID=A0AAN9DKK2_9TELE
MTELGEDALTFLENSASSVLRNRTGPHAVGCIREPKEEERLNCALLSTFSAYLQTASGLDEETELCEKLLNIGKRVEDLKNARCSPSLENTCEEIFHKDEHPYKTLEKVRSLLVLYIQWIVRPME